MAHLSKSKDHLLARLKRIAGQIAAVERAIESDTDCARVLQQVAGARGAIDGLMSKLIEEHLREHVAAPGLSTSQRAAGAEELLEAIQRYAK